MDTTNDIQILTHCENVIYAEEIQSRLTEIGIECFMRDETPTEVLGSASGHRATVAVYVHAKDLPAAKSVIEAAKYAREEQSPWCPKCGNEDNEKTVIQHKHGPTWLLVLCIAIFIIGNIVALIDTSYAIVFPILIVLIIIWCKSYREEIYSCNKCGHVYRKIKY